ncbi:hypothetical protein P8452_55798 [Trifolium repens]|nr:hypothetical protein P8452_55798 [Trifolium repens]
MIDYQSCPLHESTCYGYGFGCVRKKNGVKASLERLLGVNQFQISNSSSLLFNIITLFLSFSHQNPKPFFLLFLLLLFWNEEAAHTIKQRRPQASKFTNKGLMG